MLVSLAIVMAWLWTAFVGGLLALIALDVFVFQRRPRAVSGPEAWVSFARWVLLSAFVGVGVYWAYDTHWLGLGDATKLDGVGAATRFAAAYLVEVALGIDNLLVIAVILAALNIPRELHHRVLFMGIVLALLLRGVLLGAGIAVFALAPWVTYVVGVLLVYSAVKMLLLREGQSDPKRNLVIRLINRRYPTAPAVSGPALLGRVEGKLAVTPVLVALLLIESADVAFAVDSIPAVLTVVRDVGIDPFIVVASNMFAVLTLRALFFAIADVLKHLAWLKVALSVMLLYLAAMAFLGPRLDAHTFVTLGVIGCLVVAGAGASLLSYLRKRRRGEIAVSLGSPLGEDAERLARLATRQLRRLIVLVVGVGMFLFGLIVGVLPGVPGIPIMIVACMLMATEFLWARALLKKLQEKAAQLAAAAKRMAGGKG
ncbi:MAG: TerC/Alx family metal homeostasis membrane protein [Phycisphaerales bacterium]|nr:TerC/Alx family metal homeostasis membrane protein [Phycisphaerales bacterium]